jgi:large subunit ribosomal protein L35
MPERLPALRPEQTMACTCCRKEVETILSWEVDPMGKKKRKKKTKYKLKTHKGTAKRFRRTGSGKIVRTKGHQSHLRRRRSKRVKRQFRRMHPVKPAKVRKTIKRLAPYLDR